MGEFGLLATYIAHPIKHLSLVGASTRIADVYRGKTGVISFILPESLSIHCTANETRIPTPQPEALPHRKLLSSSKHTSTLSL